MHESEVAQSCLTLSDPVDCGPPGSSVCGIFQAGVLEWGAIAFSEFDGKEGLMEEGRFQLDKGRRADLGKGVWHLLCTVFLSSTF